MDSISEINQYDVIVAVQVLGAVPQPWAPDPDNPINQRRDVEVTARAVEWYKGEVPDSGAQPLTFTVTQTEPISGRIADSYGPWSSLDLSRKPRVLLFCNRLDTIEATLGEGCGLAIDPADQSYPYAVDDLRVAQTLRQRPDFPAALDSQATQSELYQRRVELGPLLGRFLADTRDDLDSVGFTRLLYRLLAAKDATLQLRAVLLQYLSERVMLVETVSLQERAALIRVMAGILREPPARAQVLQESVGQALLASAVLDGEGRPYLHATEVFTDANDRAEIAKRLAAHQMEEERRDRLIRWLKGP